ncbi:MAG: DUF3298 domain-containing protein [Candidatus Kapaibacterium sp.]
MKYLLCLVGILDLFQPSKCLAQHQRSLKYQFGNSYKRFEGTIGELPIVMYLTWLDSPPEGSYFYRKVGQPITLEAGNNPGASSHPETFVLTEGIFGDTASTNNTLLMSILNDSSLSGVWLGKGKTLPVKLKESYPKGSYRFDELYIQDTAGFSVRKVFWDKIDCSYALPLPKDRLSAEERDFILSKVMAYLDCDSVTRPFDIAACVHSQSKSFFDSSRVDILDEVSSMSRKEVAEEKDRLRLWSSGTTMDVLYNEDDILSLQLDEGGFTGGAHDWRNFDLHTLDVRNRKVLALSDITTADSAIMERALAKAFRKQYHHGPDQELSEMLFEDYLPANNNFYITPGGISFVYSQYEVASWAEGPIEVFVPFSALKDKLTPWFKERMGL